MENRLPDELASNRKANVSLQSNNVQTQSSDYDDLDRRDTVSLAVIPAPVGMSEIQNQSLGENGDEEVPDLKNDSSASFYNNAVVYPYEAYTYEKMMEDAQLLVEKYPETISLDSIGKSVEGRELLLIKLGMGDEKIILCATHHAREYIGSTFLMKMTEAYAEHYHAGITMDRFNVKDLLDKVTIYIVPMVNPDGVNLVNNGIETVQSPEKVKSLKMMQKSYREWKSNINGVDLNRQYPAYWEESIPTASVPASEHYKGTKAASEPEVQALMKLCDEEDFGLAVSFHTKGEVIFWADRGTVDEIPNAKEIAVRYSELTGYVLMPVSEEPAKFGAGFENWFRLKYKKPAFCVELTPVDNTNMPHPDERFDELVWLPAKNSGIFFAEEVLR